VSINPTEKEKNCFLRVLLSRIKALGYLRVRQTTTLSQYPSLEVELEIHMPRKINHLTPNGHYMGRTAQLTSRCCILYIYSTNIRTEYFKHTA